ncbi:unnamed protein product [Microthlaspi erraticum]|uniref:Strictosidine synthase conserved region domain-containing protein n=1 Tax=Microthlaspi erraticum TaxID=1685480 RepID=A0A6D2L2A2_9BRAS|nr:unnamed protein product [Microthlaspi erraticum]
MDTNEEEDAIYFNDSSDTYHFGDVFYAFLCGEKTGRAIRYDKKTKKAKVVMDHLHFPNGLALSKDGSFVLSCEVPTQFVHRYWAKGPKAGTRDIFAKLPGYADNIRRTETWDFWVALHSKKTPFSRRPHAVAVKLCGETGEVLEILEDSERKNMKFLHGYKSCIQKERNALFELKQFIISNSEVSNNASFPTTTHVLPTWTNGTTGDCCRLKEIKCNRTTGRVTGIVLENLYFKQSSLLNLSLLHPFEEVRRLKISAQGVGLAGLFDDVEGMNGTRRNKTRRNQTRYNGKEMNKTKQNGMGMNGTRWNEMRRNRTMHNGEKMNRTRQKGMGMNEMRRNETGRNRTTQNGKEMNKVMKMG